MRARQLGTSGSVWLLSGDGLSLHDNIDALCFIYGGILFDNTQLDTDNNMTKRIML
jgi:hypothetical protein